MSKRASSALNNLLEERANRRKLPVMPSLIPGMSGSQQVRVNQEQMHSLMNLFHRNPALQAARTVIHSQILSGGIVLKREGETIPMTAEFHRHVEEFWIPFCKEVIDSVMVFGFAVVSYEDASMLRTGIERAQSARSERLAMPPGASQGSGNVDMNKFGVGLQSVAPFGGATGAVGRARGPTIVPVVPALGTYDLAFSFGGNSGYVRQYIVFNRENGMQEDKIAEIFVKEHPTTAGYINSQIASVYELGSFVDAITELALVAETSRAHPAIVTQHRKVSNAATVTPADMYFDREGETNARDQQNRENETNARMLKNQQDLCMLLNELQTRVPSDGRGGFQRGPSGASAGMSGGGGFAARVRSETTARLFALPEQQEVANTQLPEVRGDLVELWRTVADYMCSSIGVPSALIFETQHGSHDRSHIQMSLFNATVQQIGAIVNRVLRATYARIYGGDGASKTTELVTASTPLLANEDVIAAHTAGLIDFEDAAPLVMGSLGLPQSAIERALKRRKMKEEEEKKIQEEDRKMMKEAHKKAMAAPSTPATKSPSGSGGSEGSGGSGGSGRS